MLYYLKQEVIGEHSDSVLKGADIRYLIYIYIYIDKCAHKQQPVLAIYHTLFSFSSQGC